MLTGCIDEATRERVRGWVRDPAFPATAVSLLITADNQLLQRVVANGARPDVEKAGFGDGRFGFDVTFNPPLLPTRSWLVHVRSEFDGRDIPGSPVRIAPAISFDAATEAAVAGLLADCDDEAGFERRLAFLSAQRDRLLRTRADRRVRAPAARRALVVDERLPVPGRDGGSSALLSHVRSLQRLGYEVALAAADIAGASAAAAAKVLERAGVVVHRPPMAASVEEVLRREAGGLDVVYLHRGGVAAAYSVLVRQLQPRARLVFSVADLHHLRLGRQARVEGRPELLAEAARLRRQEMWAASMADAVITHSSYETDLLRQALPAERVHTVAWSMPKPTRLPAFGRRDGMAFIGHFGHAPNVAAVRYLRNEFMPRLHALAPEIGCHLVGHDAPPWFRTPQPWLAGVGPVDRIGDVFGKVRLTLALLPFGAGLKSKVMESLAAGVPCLCSPVAAEGFDLPEPLGDLVAGNLPSALQLAIRLHEDGAFNRRMAEAGRAFAKDRFSEPVLDAGMRAALGLAAAEPAG